MLQSFPSRRPVRGAGAARPLAAFVVPACLVLLCTLVATPLRAERRGVFTVEDDLTKLDGERLVASFDAAALRSGPLRLELPVPDTATGEGHRFATFSSRWVQMRPDGGVTWRGEQQQGEQWPTSPGSSAQPDQLVLRLHRGRLAGAVFTEDGNFDILPMGPGTISVRRAVAEGPCATREPSTVAPAEVLVPSVPDKASGPVTLSVLALYTEAAQTAAGGVDEIEATILAAADATNTIFANGPIDATVEIVHLAPFDLALLGSPPDLQTALDRLILEPGVQALRDEVRADVVALVVEQAGGFCGIGEAMDQVGPAFESQAYSISSRICLLTAMTLAHEIGHNMGARHNPEDSEATPSTASYPWSFGHVGSAFRTVMAYDTTCTAGCPRLPYFSDPDRKITLAGSIVDEPAGIAGQRDNVRTLQLTAPIVAAFREAETPPPGPTCVETDTRRCLLGERFAVEVSWRDFEGNTGPGRQLTLPSDASVLFWFFGFGNWELLVKVLDGCPINDRVWVFTAGATNVEYELTVTDTVTGEERFYDNPLGRTAVTLTDTDAFAACGD